MADLPRFRSPLDRWPRGGDAVPRPLAGPSGQARAILALVVPSLSEARQEEIAPVLGDALRGSTITCELVAAVLLCLAPELFEEPDHG